MRLQQVEMIAKESAPDGEQCSCEQLATDLEQSVADLRASIDTIQHIYRDDCDRAAE